MKSKNKIFLFSIFSIFIILFALNISFGLEDNGVTINEVTNSAKANCMSSQTMTDCDPANWTSCNENLRHGEFFITDCEDCSIDRNAYAGDPGLCCKQDSEEG